MTGFPSSKSHPPPLSKTSTTTLCRVPPTSTSPDQRASGCTMVPSAILSCRVDVDHPSCTRRPMSPTFLPCRPAYRRALQYAGRVSLACDSVSPPNTCQVRSNCREKLQLNPCYPSRRRKERPQTTAPYLWGLLESEMDLSLGSSHHCLHGRPFPISRTEAVAIQSIPPADIVDRSRGDATECKEYQSMPLPFPRIDLWPDTVSVLVPGQATAPALATVGSHCARREWKWDVNCRPCPVSVLGHPFHYLCLIRSSTRVGFLEQCLALDGTTQLFYVDRCPGLRLG